MQEEQKRKAAPPPAEEPTFSEDEAEDIYERAAEIHADTLFTDQEEKLTQDEVEDNAERAGIDEKFVEQAIAERQAEQKREAAERERRAAEAAEAERLAQAKRKKWTRIALVSTPIVLLLGLLMAMQTQSVLGRDRATIETAKTQVENVLQRRKDLVPRLLAVSGGENDASLKAALDRSNAAGDQELGQRAAAEADLGGEVNKALGKLRAEGGKDEIVLRLLAQVEGAENRIAVERKRYNSAVIQYNRKAGSFPYSVLGPVLGYPRAYDTWK